MSEPLAKKWDLLRTRILPKLKNPIRESVQLNAALEDPCIANQQSNMTTRTQPSREPLSLEPTVTLQASSGALEFSLSYIVTYTKRTIVKDHLFTKIVDEIANNKDKLAWAPSSPAVVLWPATADLHEPANMAFVKAGSVR